MTGLLASLVLLGCQSETPLVDGPISAYRDRMLVQHDNESRLPPTPRPLRVQRDPVAEPAQAGQPARASLMASPSTATQPAPTEVLTQIPDPTESAQSLDARLTSLREEFERARVEGRQPIDPRLLNTYERVVSAAKEYLSMIALPTKVPLSLSECIQRTIEHNYNIRIEAHNPAISQAQIVEAEAAFDAQFFLNTNISSLDQPLQPSSIPGSGESTSRTVAGGFRQLLPTGMTASIGPSITRDWSGAPQGQIKTWNPIWSSNFTANLTQPLLRGFGLDINRAPIEIRRVEHKISYEVFVQRVRDTLLDAETAYWNLVQARRRAAVQAEAVAQYRITYENMVARRAVDATEVEVANSLSSWQSQQVTYLESVKLVRDAEDALKILMNDPDFKLSQHIEIVPTEPPIAVPFVLDQFAEVRTALDRRTEIRQAKEQINLARINTNVSKNAILPQLDLSFQYQVQGLGNSADNAFHTVTANRYVSYTVGVTFAYDIGERRGRAQYRQAQLRESQAVVTLQQVTDGVVLEVNNGVRQLMVRYEQIPPAFDSVQAAVRNLRALQARAVTINPPYLQTELSGVEQLVSTRSTLLTVLTQYNLGIVQLEKAKGTLLEYNNVTVAEDKPPR